MLESTTQTSSIDLKSPQYYVSRELSWLEFNRRVLHEALDERTPLLERLKFLAIFSANLDEFFMVRIAALKQQVDADVDIVTPDGRTPKQQLKAISEVLRPMVIQQHHHFEQVLRPLLVKQGVHILNYVDLTQEQRSFLQHYFEQQIFPVLTPLAVDPSHPFPYISNLSFNLAVVVRDATSGKENFARLKVPTLLPRFIPFPEELWAQSNWVQDNTGPVVWVGIPLEQAIAHNLESLFPGMSIQEYYPFRITRDTDLELKEDEADDLLLAMEQELRGKRRIGGSVVRMEIQKDMAPGIRDVLMREMGLQERDIYEVEGLMGLKDLFALTGLPLADQKDRPWSPTTPSRLAQLSDPDLDTRISDGESTGDFFRELREGGDLLVHHPYQSFTASVQRFITQAAHDPDVLAIKMTLYRTSGDSPIINALIQAAENGKQVAVLVELKARFDEENNILWARKLEQYGVHVVYGLVGLKTHTKTVLVVRREGDQMRRYVHIGTGNYNPKTARLYTDLGLFSCREELGADLTDLFNYLTGYSRQHAYRKLLVAPVNLRDRMVNLIRREIDHSRGGKQGRIVAKMNALVDPDIIATLYEASQSGVSVDLIIRGMCSVRPGLPGVSENIRVMSIIGRFLEHSRIFYFHNGGEDEVYIGSADWMPRNLDRRVEAVTPILDPRLGKQLQELLGIMLADNRQAWDLQADGTYVQRRPPEGALAQSSQQILMDMALQDGR